VFVKVRAFMGSVTLWGNWSLRSRILQFATCDRPHSASAFDFRHNGNASARRLL